MRTTKKRNDLRARAVEIVNWYHSFVTAEKIGLRLGVSKGLILKILRENNIVRRKAAPFKGRIPWNKGGTNPKVAGANHHSWKGGVTPLVIRIRRCARYRNWVVAIFERDNYTCRTCGKRGGDKQADHFPKMFCDVLADNKITTYEGALQCRELWSLENGRTLCKSCHRRTFTFKGNQYKELK